jgi:8-oxo-dGTP pyrophosphatase MutT (NUDIX family)
MTTAQRELIEEAGMEATEWSSLGVCTPSPGVLQETVHLFFARGLTPTTAAPESAEVFEIHWIALDEAYRWVVDGTINDAKTGVALARVMSRMK